MTSDTVYSMKEIRNKRVGSLMLLGIFAPMLFFTSLLSGCDSGPRGTQPTIETGKPAPSFTLELIDGKKVTLEEFRGKSLVLITMASWCPCSHDSAPIFNEAYEKYRPKGVEFLMLGIQDSRRKFTKFIQKKGFKFPAGFDEGDKISKIYGVSAPPTTFFIDAEGRVVSAFYGKIIDRDLLFSWIDEIVNNGTDASHEHGENAGKIPSGG